MAKVVEKRQHVGVKKIAKRKTVDGLYYPDVSRLKNNFEGESRRFLKSLKKTMDGLEKKKRTVLLCLEKEIHATNKRTRKLNLMLKSTRYWKQFFGEFIKRCDDIIETFRFDNLESVENSMKNLNISPSLQSFVGECLIQWRKLFEHRPWMSNYQQLTMKKNGLNQEIVEYEEKQKTSISILEYCESLGIDINEILDIEPDKLEEWMKEKVEIAKKEKEIKETNVFLNGLPSSSKKHSTRQWCKEHYDPKFECLSSEEEDDSSSYQDKSSLFGEGGNSETVVSSTTSSTEQDNQLGGFDSFFSSKGL